LETARGTFRSDLYFRLSGASIVVPPLRDRIDDIQPLAELFIEQVAEQAGRARPKLSSRALELLLEYAWPGNIRELRNVIERAVLLCSTSSIGPEHLPVEHMGRTLPVYSEVPSRVVPGPEPRRSLPKKLAPTIRPPSSRPAVSRMHAAKDARSSVGPRSSVRGDERSRIVAALESCAGNQTHAAKMLGISRRTLISRIEQYGLRRPRKRAE
jgi:DNA-binding NtrC family response regulator